jgi:integrase
MKKKKTKKALARTGGLGDDKPVLDAETGIEVLPPLTETTVKLATVLKLTTTLVDQLPPGIFWDEDLKGYGVRVSPKFKRVFFANGRVRGTGIERRPTIGARPQWDAPRARKEAQRLLRLMDQGIDPLAEARALRAAPTVADLADRYLAEVHSKSAAGRVKGSNRDKDHRKMVQVIVGGLGARRRVADVHEGDAQALHDAITASGRPVRANRIKAVGRAMFNLAAKAHAGKALPWRTADQSNPFKSVENNHEEGKERYFSRDELARIMRAATLVEWARRGARRSVVEIDVIRMAAYTGGRPCELYRATWAEFDHAEGDLWKKPSSHTKQRKIHRLVLNQPALELIDRLRKANPDRKPTDLVFPRTDGQPLRRLDKIWHAILEAAGIAKDAKGHWPRPYDLRHTVASVAGHAGFSLPLIGALLGHSTPTTTARYTHFAGAEAVAEAAEAVGRAVAADKSAEVRPFSRPIPRR